MRLGLLSILCGALCGSQTLAGPPILGKTEDELAGTLRGLLLNHLPSPLYEKSTEWGKTKDVKVLRIHDGKPVWELRSKNDGVWKKIRVDAISPRDNLIVDLRDVAQPGAGTITFTLFAAGDIRFDATQEKWESGVKLYGASIRARAHVKATLHCEASIHPELAGYLPELVCTLKVTRSEVGYENLVVEHLAGLGGDAAKTLGAAGHGLINQWKPSLERELLQRANRAVLKAGQEKQVRIGLSKLFKRN